MSALKLDHLVLPTARLDIARHRLGALGFTVAPQGTHPFGTINCCVYLADGTFMEPLAVGNDAAATQAIRAGNVFVARDRAYRDRCGDEGFSAIVLASDDATADHRRYLEAGVSAGDMLEFSRPFVDASGNSDIASFRLAFAAGAGTNDAFLFACERVNAPNVDRTALQAHANGARRMAEVVAVSNSPLDQQTLLSIAADAVPFAEGGAINAELPNAMLCVLDPDGFEARFNVPAGAFSALRFAAVVFDVLDIEALKGHLATHAVVYDTRSGVVVVPPAPGQGAAFIFREQS